VNFQAAGSLIPRTTLEVLVDYSADLISNLGDEARRKINGILAQAALGTVGPFEAMQRIAGNLPEPSVFRTLGSRAEAIYRTETNRVFSIAAQARMNEMGERLPRMKKRWLAVLDARTRATHIAASGQVVAFDGFFSVGGQSCQFPRDPTLSAKESVNCRCHSVPVLDDEVMEDLGVPPETVPPPEPVPPIPPEGQVTVPPGVEPAPAVPVAGQPEIPTWLTEGEITDVQEYNVGSLNELWTGKIGERQVLIKPFSGLRTDQVRDLIEPGMDLERERAALFMAGEFGEDLLTPGLVTREVETLGPSIVSEWVENSYRTDLEALDLVAAMGGGQFPGDLRYADMRIMALYDSVIGNLDRHMANLLEASTTGDAGIITRLHAIDHGLAFPIFGSEGWGNAYLLDMLATNARSGLEARELALLQRLLNDHERITRELLERGLRDEEVDALFARLDWLLAEGRLPKASELFDGSMYES
jgi:hypothetical protein